MKKLSIAASLFAVLILGGCGNTTGERAGSGALMGVAAGGLIGAASGGNFGEGALIGAGVGAVSGYLYDQHQKGNID